MLFLVLAFAEQVLTALSCVKKLRAPHNHCLAEPAESASLRSRLV